MGQYVASGEVSGDGRLITTDQLADFMREASDWLPQKLGRWITAVQ